MNLINLSIHNAQIWVWPVSETEQGKRVVTLNISNSVYTVYSQLVFLKTSFLIPMHLCETSG